MARLGVDLSKASDALRSELIFLPADGSVTRIDDGFVIRTPSNPGFWWGNTIRFDRGPAEGDVVRWPAAFAAHVHAVQPASTHMTFGWTGDDRGAIEPFVSGGFEYFETLALTVDRGEPVAAPWPARDQAVRRLAGDDWASLAMLEVDTRDEKHSAASYLEFISRRIDGWRSLEASGQGGWFGILDGTRVVSALGIFAERERGADGRRIGRFQHVATHPARRREGLAGTLVAHATRFAFDHLDVDTALISADANDVARRVYEACGYRFRSRHHGLERGG